MRATSASVDQAQRAATRGRDHHAGGDRFAMQPGAIAQTGLDRMAERVAEIQQRALAGSSRSSWRTTSALFSHERWIA